MTFNPFLTNVPLPYPLKTSKHLQFSDVFKGYISVTIVENGLKKFDCNLNWRKDGADYNDENDFIVLLLPQMSH